jgi:hypothetical protein
VSERAETRWTKRKLTEYMYFVSDEMQQPIEWDLHHRHSGVHGGRKSSLGGLPAVSIAANR